MTFIFPLSFPANLENDVYPSLFSFFPLPPAVCFPVPPLHQNYPPKSTAISFLLKPVEAFHFLFYSISHHEHHQQTWEACLCSCLLAIKLCPQPVQSLARSPGQGAPLPASLPTVSSLVMERVESPVLHTVFGTL